ncbi:PTPRA-like protein [Mya arenaria]|uniref:PTPRA-like protein n=1 Tax=Mya arenaria TaxID=6604 RepID=A0ABY7F9C3_MYAAR|nr:PTPRA-like protein [Mya arenaria]
MVLQNTADQMALYYCMFAGGTGIGGKDVVSSSFHVLARQGNTRRCNCDDRVQTACSEYAEYTEWTNCCALQGQYQFLHTAVVYSLTFDCKQIKGENFNEYMNRHSTQVLNTQFKFSPCGFLVSYVCWQWKCIPEHLFLLSPVKDRGSLYQIVAFHVGLFKTLLISKCISPLALVLFEVLRNIKECNRRQFFINASSTKTMLKYASLKCLKYHLQQTLETRSKDETEAVERNKQHLSKNRANADIPGKLQTYITEVFVMKKRYLVAQTPLPETVIDFLTLAVQERCSCIVSFEADMEKQKNIGIYYPAANQEVLKKGTLQVSCSREENKTFYAERTLTIQHKGTSTYRTIPHLQFTDWDEMENKPRSTTNFLSFLNVIDDVMKQQDDGPILVHCFDGAGKSGLFCVVSLLLHKMAVEHEVSVLNAVRKVKTTRRLAIPNQEQFVFCHGCVSEYLRSFDVYANFNDETGQP